MEVRHRSKFAVIALLALWVPTVQAAAPAGKFPDKPIRWVIPFPPGGSNDVLARYLGIKLTERVGEQVVIDNRGGANGIIGAEIAANSPADGYTLLMVSTSWVMNAAIRPLPYDVEKSFDPITLIGSSPNSIVVNPKGPYQSLRELVAAAKAKPASIFYASTGIGGFNHFGGELFKKVAHIDMVMVPYKGGGPAMIDVMAGNIPVMFSSVTQALPHVRAGRLKFLAVGGAKRSAVVPEVPTVAESGFPDYKVAVWWGIAAPHGVSPAIMKNLYGEFRTILGDTATRNWLSSNAAAEAQSSTPAEFRKLIHSDIIKWRGVAKSAGIVVK